MNSVPISLIIFGIGVLDGALGEDFVTKSVGAPPRGLISVELRGSFREPVFDYTIGLAERTAIVLRQKDIGGNAIKNSVVVERKFAFVRSKKGDDEKTRNLEAFARNLNGSISFDPRRRGKPDEPLLEQQSRRNQKYGINDVTGTRLPEYNNVTCIILFNGNFEKILLLIYILCRRS